jgi:hypothetical protein
MSQTASATVSAPLHEEAGFCYLNASDVPSDSIVQVLSESFSRVPMARALVASARDLAPFVRRFMPECMSNGLSVVAVREDDPQTVVAAFLSRDFKSPVPEDILEDCPWFLPAGQALMSIGEVYEASHPNLKRGDVADLWMVGTDAQFALRGIASRMFRLCLRLARERGFRCCVAEWNRALLADGRPAHRLRGNHASRLQGFPLRGAGGLRRHPPPAHAPRVLRPEALAALLRHDVGYAFHFAQVEQAVVVPREAFSWGSSVECSHRLYVDRRVGLAALRSQLFAALAQRFRSASLGVHRAQALGRQ